MANKRKSKNKISAKAQINFRRILDLLKSKAVVKILVILSLIVLFHFSYSAYSYIKYDQLALNHKDFKLRSVINSKFPENYHVKIKTADLIGLGEKYYIAYGNADYIKNAYFVGGDTALKIMKLTEGKFNLPMVKIFYVKEPSLIRSIFSITPFIDVVNSIVELSVKEFGSYCFVPQDSIDVFQSILNYNTNYRFPRTFMISNLEVADVDSDDRDELIVSYLVYAGGSGGTKYALIFEIVENNLKISSGFPDILDIEFSRFLQAIYKYSGLYNKNDRDEKLLKYNFDINANSYKVDSFDRKLIETHIIPDSLLVSILEKSNDTSPDDSRILFDYYTKDQVNVFTRRTDDFSEFVNIDGKMIFIDSFYILGGECHWCPHYWRIMSFLYRDGRWISDRNVNGDMFLGIWLDENKKFTLNDVFGTYPNQGIAGIAHSFVNSEWTLFNKFGISDFYGFEMIKKSPVIKKVESIYLER